MNSFSTIDNLVGTMYVSMVSIINLDIKNIIYVHLCRCQVLCTKLMLKQVKSFEDAIQKSSCVLLCCYKYTGSVVKICRTQEHVVSNGTKDSHANITMKKLLHLL